MRSPRCCRTRSRNCWRYSPNATASIIRQSPRPRATRSAPMRRRRSSRSRSTTGSVTCWSTNTRTPRRRRRDCSNCWSPAGSPRMAEACSAWAIRCSPSMRSARRTSRSSSRHSARASAASRSTPSGSGGISARAARSSTGSTQTFSALLPAADDFERGAVRYSPAAAAKAGEAGDGVRVHPLLDADAARHGGGSGHGRRRKRSPRSGILRSRSWSAGGPRCRRS